LTVEAIRLPERDLKAQAAVLDLLLLERQDSPTAGEVEADLADEVSLANEGAIGWAIEDLIRVGLLERDGEQVRPTPSAVHFQMVISI
jgi:hypothetical protein